METLTDMGESKASDLICQMRATRQEILDLMESYSADDLEVVSLIRNKTVREMLRTMNEHYQVHQTQIYNQRISAQERTTEVTALVSEAQSSFEKALCMTIGISEECSTHKIDESEWSIVEVLEHLLEFEIRYLDEFQRLLKQKLVQANQESQL
jgi:hypothetical protein